MCPIRHFKENVVKFLDSFSNFVFAVDAVGNLAIFRVDENDLENDEDTMQTVVFQCGDEPVGMYVYPADKERKGVRNRNVMPTNDLVVITKTRIFHFNFMH